MLPFDPKKPFYGFTARFPHAKRRIHLFSDERYIYFRPKNAPSDWWGVFLDFGRKELPVETNLKVRELLAKKQFYRFLQLPDPRKGQSRWWGIFWRPDAGYAIPFEHPRDLDGAYFRPRPSLLNLKSSTTVIRQRFELEWQNSHSDVRSALPWCDLSRCERSVKAIHWSNGGWADLKVLINAFFGCEKNIWLRTEGIFFSMYIYESKMRFGFKYGYGGIAPLTPRLERAMRTVEGLFESFIPRIYDDRLVRPQTINGKIHSLKFWSCRFRVTLLDSAHQHIETQLFLHDWLRENAPDLLPDWFPDEV